MVWRRPTSDQPWTSFIPQGLGASGRSDHSTARRVSPLHSPRPTLKKNDRVAERLWLDICCHGNKLTADCCHVTEGAAFGARGRPGVWTRAGRYWQKWISWYFFSISRYRYSDDIFTILESVQSCLVHEPIILLKHSLLTFWKALSLWTILPGCAADVLSSLVACL